MVKKYRVTLEADEREQLGSLLAKGKADVRRLKHAQILLAADESDGAAGQTDDSIADGVGVGRATVERVRRRFVEEGLGKTRQSSSPGRGSHDGLADGGRSSREDRHGSA